MQHSAPTSTRKPAPCAQKLHGYYALSELAKEHPCSCSGSHLCSASMIFVYNYGARTRRAISRPWSVFSARSFARLEACALYHTGSNCKASGCIRWKDGGKDTWPFMCGRFLKELSLTLVLTVVFQHRGTRAEAGLVTSQPCRIKHPSVFRQFDMHLSLSMDHGFLTHCL